MVSAQQQNTLPIFYNDIIPLNSNDHKAYRIKPSKKALFLADQHAVPLTIDEFIQAQHILPIVFTRGEDPVPIALMGLNQGANTLMADDGRIRTDRPFYMPAYIRRYPWMLVRLQDDSEELSLCFDPTADVIGAYDDGDRLIDDEGKATEIAQGVLKFCEDFEQAVARTSQFMRYIKELDLLMEGEVSINVPGKAEPFVYRGFQMINEAKLRGLRGDQLRKISQNGILPLLYVHLFSLQLISVIFELQAAQGKGPIGLSDNTPT